MLIDITKLSCSALTLKWIRNRKMDGGSRFPEAWCLWGANRRSTKKGKKGGGKKRSKNDAQYTQWFLNTHHAAPRSHRNH